MEVEHELPKTVTASKHSAHDENHQDELDRLTEDQTRLQAAFDATNSGSGGILLRLEALSRLSDTNSTLWAAQVMLSLLFMCVEILPVLMKLLLNFSPPSTYDRLTAMRDSADLDVEGLQQQARRTVEQAEAELLVLAEKERVDRQRDAVLARRRSCSPAGRIRRSLDVGRHGGGLGVRLDGHADRFLGSVTGWLPGRSR